MLLVTLLLICFINPLIRIHRHGLGRKSDILVNDWGWEILARQGKSQPGYILRFGNCVKCPVTECCEKDDMLHFVSYQALSDNGITLLKVL